jgi:hypothetical protein
VRLVDSKGDPLDPVFRHLIEGETTDLAYHLSSFGEDRGLAGELEGAELEHG